MTDGDNAPTRRRFVLGTVGVTTALAGCTGSNTPADGDDASQGSEEPTSTPDSSTPTSDATDTQTPGDETTPDGSDSVCAPLAANPTGYDVSGTPYIFAFDYPETWTVGEPIPGQNGRFQQITSPEVTIDGDPKTVTVRIGQSLPALSASEVEAEKDELTTRDADSLAIVDEQSFSGETVEVLGFPGVPASFFPSTYLLHLPYGSGDGREYYRTSIVTYTDIYTLEGEERAACNGLIRTAIEAVRSSLRPNPETTVEDI